MCWAQWAGFRPKKPVGRSGITAGGFFMVPITCHKMKTIMITATKGKTRFMKLDFGAGACVSMGILGFGLLIDG